MAVISNGTTLIDAGALDSSVASGPMNLLSSQTASGSANISFTSGITSAYKEYLFTFHDIHPATDGAKFGFQFNASGESGFNETLTSMYWRTYNNEAANSAGTGYVTSEDQAQGTAFTILDGGVGADADQCTAGHVKLFDPSNTSHVKHFIFRGTHYDVNNFVADVFVGGYVNTTAAITEMQFKFSSGNIDAGTIKMYGIK